MEWIVVYDYAAESTGSPVYLYGILFAATWYLNAIRSFRNERKARGYILRAVVSVAAGTFGLAFSLGIGSSLPADLSRTPEDYNDGNYEIVEGIVEDFVPMPVYGHSLESFTIDGVYFEYSDYDRTHIGFNRTRSHGGPIDEGKRLRITYIPDDFGRNVEPRNVILRIEEARISAGFSR